MTRGPVTPQLHGGGESPQPPLSREKLTSYDAFNHRPQALPGLALDFAARRPGTLGSLSSAHDPARV